ncbi:similar to Saccharomyces cerevisiae YML065W ORC1 Largest subunit of the origin recognition complex [Maudiozyma saulgeensis]|uniref:Similar to Saccharomyces cerevisiae YML065W ORC1 Largest subunit of the origin recognition complex n=1 Tax=Maudiozyma saulgeensis TaxID=1789683 RepID=A0A1X7R8N2_9SACH|nr:similar to Saccharomyces cerevisiae YML065W ORC1 Largest subunit of the origin recognition complex [Kazachstania saulgeensis]
MAANLKDMEGWQIVNVDETGKIINENRTRRSRTGNRIKSTFLQRISDGLSFGVGDNVITHDSVTQTYSVYLVHEIRQNTVKSLVEIWAFSYLRWFELNGAKYFSQFDPRMLEKYPNTKELNQQLFKVLDHHELFLTAELVEFNLSDFIDLATIVSEKDYKIGKAIPDKDFAVKYICEPTGENFVKINISHELKLIKQMPTKQSDEHLKRLSTQHIRPVSIPTNSSKKIPLQATPILTNGTPSLTAVTVASSGGDDAEDINDDLPLSSNRRRRRPKSYAFSQSTDSDDTSSQKRNSADVSRNNMNDSNVISANSPENGKETIGNKDPKDREETIDNKDHKNEHTAVINLLDIQAPDVYIRPTSEGPILIKKQSNLANRSTKTAENTTKPNVLSESNNLHNIPEQNDKVTKKTPSLFVEDIDDDSSVESDNIYREIKEAGPEFPNNSTAASVEPHGNTSGVQSNSDAESVNSFHETHTYLPSEYDNLPSSSLEPSNNTKRKLPQESEDIQEIHDKQPEKKKSLSAPKLDDKNDKNSNNENVNRTSTMENTSKTLQSTTSKGKQGSAGSVLINPSTFKLIKTNYDKTLELINNFQNVNVPSTELQYTKTSDGKDNTPSAIGTMMKYDPEVTSENDKQTLYSQIKGSSNKLSIELKLRSITRKKEGLSDVCNVFVDIYYDLFLRIRACTPWLLFCTTKKAISAEYVLQEVFTELSLSYRMKELQPFSWTHIYPIANPTIASLITQIWKNISGEFLQAKQAIGALFHFCKNVPIARKKYLIIVIHNFESILNSPNHSHLIDVLMKLVQFPNSKLSIICVGNETPQLLKLFPNKTDNEIWSIINLSTYPTNAIKMVIHSILYNKFFGTFFVKQESESSSWSIRNLDSLITTPIEYKTAVSKAAKDGYITKHVKITAEETQEIISLLESHATYYDELLNNCKKAIFIAKWTYVKGLTNKEIGPNDDAFLIQSNVQSVIDSVTTATVFERVASLPAISRLLLISSLLDDDGNISNGPTVLHFSEMKNRMIKYIDSYENTPTIQQIKSALSPNPDDLNEIIESVNWRFLFGKLKILGLINFSMKNEEDVNSIFFTILCNRQALKSSLQTCGSTTNTIPKVPIPS